MAYTTILDYWDFQLKFRYLNSFPMEKFYFEYFLTGGNIGLNSYQSLFLLFPKNIPSLLMCPFFGLKCPKIHWFWSSFDLLEYVLSVPNNIITFFSQKIKKVFFSLIFCNFFSLWKNGNFERKKIFDKNFLVFFRHGDFE